MALVVVVVEITQYVLQCLNGTAKKPRNFSKSLNSQQTNNLEMYQRHKVHCYKVIYEL